MSLDSPRDLVRSARDADRVVLEPVESARGNAVALALFAVFWNCILSVFIVHVTRTVLKSGFTTSMVLLSLFLVPFVLIGFFLVGVFVQQLMALRNPPFELAIEDGPLRPGRRATLHWQLSGPAHRLRRFRIMLEGVEVARYRQGTSTSTARHAFHRTALLDTTDRREWTTGRTPLIVPHGAMPTFGATSNRIVWQVHVRGHVRRWPDINLEFEVRVEPAEADA